MSTVVERAAMPAPAAGAPSVGQYSRFRPDIEGLRAVAVLLVLAYHAGLPWVTGGFVGVDVFFVISGFLITGLILREVSATGRLSVSRFYARRIRRLLPATAVVLAATAALTVAFLPPVRWGPTAWDIATSATYVVNWRLAENADYLNSEVAPSPVQHFWSLAVEEQFYILWPLLILALVWWHRRTSWSLRRTLLAGLAVIAVPSFLWSVYLTSAAAGQAYFVSTTRAWELAIGAALAIGASRLARLPRPACTVLAWAGLAAIALAALTFDAATAFPGYTALLPTLGAAAVIAAGVGSATTSAGWLLSVPVMRDIGALSYSLYLWHWPLLVAATAAWGEMGPIRGLMVVGFSVVPAWLTYRIIEHPIHHARTLAAHPAKAFTVGAIATAIGLAAAIVTTAAVPDYRTSADAPGAAALDVDNPADDPDGEPVDQVTAMTPNPLDVREDNADVYEDGCHQTQESAGLATCAYGDTDSDRVMALVGDSHAAQWQPALDEIGDRAGWRVETYTKSACGFFTVPVATLEDAPYTSCEEWNKALLEHLTGPNGPDLVVSSGSNNYRVIRDGDVLSAGEGRQYYAEGLGRSWQAVLDSGARLAVIRNTPWLDIDVPECITEQPEQLTECAASRDKAMDKSGDAQLTAAKEIDGLNIIDLASAICPTERCAPVIGDVIVWRDKHHITATYARTLASHLEAALVPYLEYKSAR